LLVFEPFELGAGDFLVVKEGGAGVVEVGGCGFPC
jgi:hypothetical protein